MNKLQPLIRLHKQELIRKQSYWSEIIAEWQKNPLSPSIWCKDKNVNKDHFYYWKRKLGKIQTSTAQKEGLFENWPFMVSKQQEIGPVSFARIKK